jgi:aspartate aminotransferase/aminotransferase
MQSLDTDGRVIAVFSFSKTYAMTGWRVGYLVGPRDIVSHILRVQEPVTSCVNSVAQKAAVAALTGDQSCVAEMRSAYASRAKLVTKILDPPAPSTRWSTSPDRVFPTWISSPA